MGTWGPGNFQDDTAADHLSGITARLVKEIEAAMAGDPVAIEPDEYWGVAVPCNIELLALLREQGFVGATAPKRSILVEWKQRFLAQWDGAIDALATGPEFESYKTQRRAVLVQTFDRLIGVADD